MSRTEEMQKEIDRLSDLLWGSRCVYCGEVVGVDRKNQDVADEVLRKHVKGCPKHPLGAALARVERLEGALREIRPHARWNNPGSAALALQRILQLVDGALEESDGE